MQVDKDQRKNPEAMAANNPQSPGEPNRDAQEPVEPVPGTADKTRGERDGTRNRHGGGQG